MTNFDEFLHFRLRDDTKIGRYKGKRNYTYLSSSSFSLQEVKQIEYLCLSLPSQPYLLSVDKDAVYMFYKNLPLNDTLRKSKISIIKNDENDYSIEWKISENGEPYIYPHKSSQKLKSLFDVFIHINKRWETIKFSKIIK